MGALHRAHQGQGKLWSWETLFGILSSAILGSISIGFFIHYEIPIYLVGSLTGVIGFLGPRIVNDAYDRHKSKQLTGK